MDYLNSHWPMLAKYRRMLNVWRSSADRVRVGMSDLKDILSAGDKS